MLVSGYMGQVRQLLVVFCIIATKTIPGYVFLSFFDFIFFSPRPPIAPVDMGNITQSGADYMGSHPWGGSPHPGTIV